MCLFCATTKAISNAYHQFRQQRKRARIYSNMMRSASRTTSYGFRSGEIIETGNHPWVHGKDGE